MIILEQPAILDRKIFPADSNLDKPIKKFSWKGKASTRVFFFFALTLSQLQAIGMTL